MYELVKIPIHVDVLIGKKRQLKLICLNLTKLTKIVVHDSFELIIGFVLPQFEHNVFDI